MKTRKRTLELILATLIIFSYSLQFVGCSQESPLQVVQPFGNDSGSPGSFNKGRNNNKSNDANATSTSTSTSSISYPQFASSIYKYNENTGYQGGSFNVPNSSQFSIDNNALTPPSGTLYGGDVEITMLIEKVKHKGNDELIFTFGPSGCQFNPPAEVILDYADLGIDTANLYYINNNNEYVEQTPDNIDIQNKKMTLYISHFSRYAIAFSR